MSGEMISLGAKLRLLAASQPDLPAVTCGADTLTYRQLHLASNRSARGLARLGVRFGDVVIVALPNGVDFVVTCWALWKLGATPLPLSFRTPRHELTGVVRLAKPVLIVADFDQVADCPIAHPATLIAPDDDDGDLPDRVSPVIKIMPTGGSTGAPKLILAGQAGVIEASTPPETRFNLRSDAVSLMPAPLYHNAPFLMMTHTIGYGGHAIFMPRFDAEGLLADIARYRPNWVYMVPTMMNRVWRLPAGTRTSYDVSSVKQLWHMAAPCPAWLKEEYIGWFGADVIWELYGGTEGMAGTTITGTEWLAHRGSVGRVKTGEIRIVDPEGKDAPSGTVGEIYMRRTAGTPETYRYIGAVPKMIAGGWQSLGDLGWFDDDGYLYIADRQTDMILVGGSNVYPAEVEAAIEQHPLVQSSVVIGLPDGDLGARVHAIVNAMSPVSAEELLEHLASRLVPYKRPRSFEFVAEPLRSDAGKVRRSALREARL